MNELETHGGSPSDEQWGSVDNIEEAMNEVLRSGTDDSFCFLNEGLIRERLGIFQDHFMSDDPDRRIIYAMKANPHPRIMTILSEEGIDGFDCASAGEIDQALDIGGIGPENLFFNNPVKRGSEIHSAYSRGVRYFTAQSRSGVEKVLAHSRLFGADNMEVATRLETLNPDAKINLSEKYGCAPKEGLHLLQRVKDAGVRAGLAMNTGSQNSSPKSFVMGIEMLAEVAKRAGGVTSLNVGGGIPVNYFPTDVYDAREYLREITRAVQRTRDSFFGGNRDKSKIIIEPGRSLVAQAVDLAIPVLEVDRHRSLKRAFINDGVFTSFSDSPIHGWKYAFEVFTKDGRKLSDALENFTVYGRTCDSGDVLGEYSFPSDLQEGDFIWVKNAGAYMDSQGSRFNGFSAPRYISYNGNPRIV